MQRLGAGVLNTMGCAGGNTNRITDGNSELFRSQCHLTLSCSDVIQFFTLRMLMQIGSLAGLDDGFGQTLCLVTLHGGMHEFPDF